MYRSRAVNAIVIGVMLCVWSPTTAAAQSVAVTFDQLVPLIKSGETVFVTADDDHTAKGSLAALTPDSLVITVASRPVTFTPAHVRQVSVRRGRATKNGALGGLAVGAGAGFVLGTALRSGDSWAPSPAGVALVFGGVGSGIGALIGTAIPRHKLVYEARPGTPGKSVAIVPYVTHGGGGVRLMVSR